MQIPTLKGLIKRRLLVNFRADPSVVRRMLPAPLRPKLHADNAIVGVCLIRLEDIRPVGLPGFAGMNSENAAHRIAVEWTDQAGLPHEGVFIPRRDTDSLLNRLAGGRLFPGEHHAARFSVSDADSHIALAMQSVDGVVRVTVIGAEAEALPATSCFRSLAEASAFFEAGSLGYSATALGDRLDGLTLRTREWRVRPLNVTKAQSSFFSDPKQFPHGTVEFDHALIMRDVPHEWHAAEELVVLPTRSEEYRTTSAIHTHGTSGQPY